MIEKRRNGCSIGLKVELDYLLLEYVGVLCVLCVCVCLCMCMCSSSFRPLFQKCVFMCDVCWICWEPILRFLYFAMLWLPPENTLKGIITTERLSRILTLEFHIKDTDTQCVCFWSSRSRVRTPASNTY